MIDIKRIINLMLVVAGGFLCSEAAIAKPTWLPDYQRDPMNVGRVIEGGLVNPIELSCSQKGLSAHKEDGKICKERKFPGGLTCYSCGCTTAYTYDEDVTCPAGKKKDPIPCDGKYQCVDCAPCPSPWTSTMPSSGVVAVVDAPDNDSSCGKCYYGCPEGYSIAMPKSNTERFIGGWRIPVANECAIFVGPSNSDGTSLCYAEKTPTCEDYEYLTNEDPSLPCTQTTVSACGVDLNCYECSCDVCTADKYPYGPGRTTCPSYKVLSGNKCCEWAERCECPAEASKTCRHGCARYLSGTECCAECTPNPDGCDRDVCPEGYICDPDTMCITGCATTPVKYVNIKEPPAWYRCWVKPMPKE